MRQGQLPQPRRATGAKRSLHPMALHPSGQAVHTLVFRRARGATPSLDQCGSSTTEIVADLARLEIYSVEEAERWVTWNQCRMCGKESGR